MAFLKKNNNPVWLKVKDTHSQRTEKTDFYSKGTWKRLRKVFILANPLCVNCMENGIIQKATVVDHIKTIRSGGSPTDLSNLQSLCDTCHNQKSGRERHGKG